MISVEKVIQDIWILNDAGAVLYHRIFNKNVDDQLIGALMSALNLLAEELERGGLSNFEIKDKKYIILKQHGLSFIVNSSKKTKEKKIKEEMKSIVNKFFNLYPKEMLNNWDNDVSIFTDFEKHIKDSLQDTIDKFEKAFW
ncbi:MAG: hypothetical protein CEE43_03005 [Promethearchaeota archaeon Loki_b32]|nr:MAG: hypothetical protein CEE43_03005 [Candidatus Lokiarchaeota archaeon Loki_b32]